MKSSHAPRHGPESELFEICRITGIAKKGPAIRKMLADTLLAQRRAQIAGKFLSGQWSAELKGYETARLADRSQAQTLSEQWRD
ncbi:MAG: hypothetical protein O3A92_00120 [Verrucomicrobia bacterium]|nr:hypothetical protein [Verrucomicrobiota bacterium]